MSIAHAMTPAPEPTGNSQNSGQSPRKVSWQSAGFTPDQELLLKVGLRSRLTSLATAQFEASFTRNEEKRTQYETLATFCQSDFLFTLRHEFPHLSPAQRDAIDQRLHDIRSTVADSAVARSDDEYNRLKQQMDDESEELIALIISWLSPIPVREAS